MRISLLLIFVCCGCSNEPNLPICLDSEGQDRANVITRILRSDNHLFLARSPELVAHKIEKMVADPYDFMRGSVALWFYDAQQVGSDRVSVPVPNNDVTRTILLIGDPHPENLSTAFVFGSNLASEASQLTMEWIDLDAVTPGPFLLDLRRAAMSLVLFFGGPTSCDEDCLDTVVNAMFSSYGKSLEAIVNGDLPEAPNGGRLIQELINEAEEEGAARKKFNKYTSGAAQDLITLMYDESLDENHRGLMMLTAAESAEVAQITQQLQAKDPSLVVLGAGRRFGQGVSSIPAKRYILIAQSMRSNKPILLNLREVFDAPHITRLDNSEQIGSRGNEGRIDLAISKIWSWSGADPFADVLRVGSQTYKVLSWSSYFQSLDHEDAQSDFANELISQNDLIAFATSIGYALATAHARGGSYQGANSTLVLYQSVAQFAGQIRAYLIETARFDALRTLEDHSILGCLVETYGPFAGIFDEMESP